MKFTKHGLARPNVLVWSLAVLGMLAAGCASGGSGRPDDAAGASPDAFERGDSGSRDIDVGTLADAGVRADAGDMDAGGADAGVAADGAMISDDAGADAGTDAAMLASDAGTTMMMSDAGTDAGSDAGNDAGTDAGTDAGADAGNDAGTDAGSDAGNDAGTDAGSDASAPPSGENCMTAIDMTSVTSVHGDTCGATDDVSVSCNPAGTPDRVYYVPGAATGWYSFGISPGFTMFFFHATAGVCGGTYYTPGCGSTGASFSVPSPTYIGIEHTGGGCGAFDFSATPP